MNLERVLGTWWMNIIKIAKKPFSTLKSSGTNGEVPLRMCK
jgi:hypothetical protein